MTEEQMMLRYGRNWLYEDEKAWLDLPPGSNLTREQSLELELDKLGTYGKIILEKMVQNDPLETAILKMSKKLFPKVAKLEAEWLQRLEDLKLAYLTQTLANDPMTQEQKETMAESMAREVINESVLSGLLEKEESLLEQMLNLPYTTAMSKVDPKYLPF